MAILELLKTVLLGIIEGITEWLPVSSTGHMILFDSFWPMDPSQYKGGQGVLSDLFLVVIQLGAILAVLVLYRHKLNPWSRRKTLPQRRATWSLWGKVIVGVIPAGIAGVLLDDFLFEHLYNAVTVAGRADRVRRRVPVLGKPPPFAARAVGGCARLQDGGF